MPQRYRKIIWIKQWKVRTDVIVWVNIAKLDRLWRHEEGYYIGREAKEDYAMPGRYRGVRTWLETQSRPMQMPHCGPYDGIVGFTDGRHRFAWMRDHGVKTMPITTSRSDRAELSNLCGSRSRGCRLPLPIRLR